MNIAERIHAAYIGERRVSVLANHLENFLPHQGSILDVGCGDGGLAWELHQRNPRLDIQGIDVLARPNARVPTEIFDGERIPLDDESVDHILLVDVLHHSEEPAKILGEAARVAKRGITIKDHLLEGWLAGPTLRMMDRVGNARHGVDMPFVYWREERWQEAWRALGLVVHRFETKLKLYPPPLTWVFDRRLHFIAHLGKA
ncbi:MAG: class I SAM-dependent methyltransferase [Myxococcota bacterium]|nr:class I SAM-dependent methyltransferase [Myxococcota bacterium]